MKAAELTKRAGLWLRACYPDAHIIEELSLAEYGGAMIDVAAVTENQIVGVEIKGDGDSPSRLKLQGAMYGRVCRHIFLLASPDLEAKCIKHKPPEWGIIYSMPDPADDERKYKMRELCELSGLYTNRGITDRVNGTMRRGPGMGLAPAALAAMIWTTEYNAFRIAVGERNFTGLPRRKADFIKFCAERYPLLNLERAVCVILRRRNWMEKRIDKPDGWKAPELDFPKEKQYQLFGGAA